MLRPLLALLVAILPVAAVAQDKPARPKLVVVISVDQFSADLFAEHRVHFTGGLKRLADAVVFPSGYQSHAATETCPGHSTILTGVHPARSGVIANSWVDQRIARADKVVYCAEDESKGASSKAGQYIPSPVHLLVPTLGDRIKAADRRSRVVSIAGKDRAAIMMGGHATDQLWFLSPADFSVFATFPDRTARAPRAIATANAENARTLAQPMAPYGLSPFCRTRARAVAITPQRSVGTGQFARAAGDKRSFRASPESDAAVLGLADGLIDELRLGRGPSTDLLAIGLSATDYVGHTYGTEGSEMCVQIEELDKRLGQFFARLDSRRLDYMVVLTADHGGHDTPERNAEDAMPMAQRVEAALAPRAVGAIIAREQGLAAPALVGSEASGDVWLDAAIPADKRAAALARAVQLYRASPQVAYAFTAAEIEAGSIPTTPPELWTPIERARASYLRGRSGDIVVLLKPRVTPIASPGDGYIATHGSAWDYDRRVPILFWRQGLTPFEQPNSVETVDIAPTLAAVLGMPVKPGEFDGRCLDLIAGAGSSCPN